MSRKTQLSGHSILKINPPVFETSKAAWSEVQEVWPYESVTGLRTHVNRILFCDGSEAGKDKRDRWLGNKLWRLPAILQRLSAILQRLSAILQRLSANFSGLPQTTSNRNGVCVCVCVCVCKSWYLCRANRNSAPVQQAIVVAL